MGDPPAGSGDGAAVVVVTSPDRQPGACPAAGAAAAWSQEVLAAHGCRISPRTGLRVAPSASMLDRLGKLLDADELEAALSAAVAAAAFDPARMVTDPAKPRIRGECGRAGNRTGPVPFPITPEQYEEVAGHLPGQ